MALTLRNWLIGYHIFEYEQHGSDRAQYGARLLETLAQDLRKRMGKGFSGKGTQVPGSMMVASCQFPDTPRARTP